MNWDDNHNLTATVEFDHSEIDTIAGWVEPPTAESFAKAVRDQRFHDAGEMLGAIITWFAESNTLCSAGAKAIALSWVIRPGAFVGVRDGTALAKSFGITKQGLSKYSAQVFRMAHGIFTSRVMQLPAARESKRQSAIEQHVKAGHHIRLRKPSMALVKAAREYLKRFRQDRTLSPEAMERRRKAAKAYQRRYRANHRAKRAYKRSQKKGVA